MEKGGRAGNFSLLDQLFSNSHFWHFSHFSRSCFHPLDSRLYEQYFSTLATEFRQLHRKVHKAVNYCGASLASAPRGGIYYVGREAPMMDWGVGEGGGGVHPGGSGKAEALLRKLGV